MKKKQRLETENRFVYVQEEIVEEILSRLPVKSLMRFKTVCKSWNSLISGCRFSKLQLKQSVDHHRTKLIYLRGCSTTLAYEARAVDIPMEEARDEDDDDVDVSVLATCNGLFCFAIAIANDAYLWNPSTKEPPRLVAVSPVEFPPSSTWASSFFGLGYHSHSDDYKLVRISMFDDPDFSFRTEVKVYSRNSGTWRRIGDFPYDYPYGRPGVFMAGCIHWIVSMSEDNAHRHRVALLNLTNERYSLIGLPSAVSKEIFFDIGSLDEKLVVFYSSKDLTSSIWILKEHGREESWTRIKINVDCVSRIEAFIYFQPLCILEPGKILLRLGAKNVASFDVEKRRRYDVCSPHILDSRMISYVESLVSPYSPLD